MATAIIEAPTAVTLPTVDWTIIRVKWREGVEPPYRPKEFVLRFGIWVNPASGLTLADLPDSTFPTWHVQSYVTLAYGIEEEDVD